MTALGREFDNLLEHAWVDQNADRVMPVGLKLANPFGIHDLLGNVNEWCQDQFATYSRETVEDPLIIVTDNPNRMRILRGGSCRTPTHHVRPSKRGWTAPDYNSSDNGFRVVAAIEWNPDRPVVFPLRRLMTPAMAETDSGQHRRIEVLPEFGQLTTNHSPWLSPDGRRIYWESIGEDGKPAFVTASRAQPWGRFENRKTLGELHQPKLTSDEMRVVGIVEGAEGPQLAEGVRTSLDEPFEIRTIPELSNTNSPHSPFIYQNGKILLFQRGGWRKPRIVWSQRKSLDSTWERPSISLFREYLDTAEGERLPWPCMSEDNGMILWFTRENKSSRECEIWTAGRTAGMSPYRNPTPVLVDGKPLRGSCPFYLAETNEFFFSRPVAGNTDLWEICRIKDFLKRE